MLERHPLSNLWDDMPKDQKEELFLDIRNQGVLEPIVIYEGMILDGWHRYMAAQQAGIPCPQVEFDGEDPGQFVISKNGMRRSITQKERARAAWLVAEWRKDNGFLQKSADDSAEEGAEKEVSETEDDDGGDGDHPAPYFDMGATHKEIADITGTSLQTARRAKDEIARERGLKTRPLGEGRSPTDTIRLLRDQLDSLEAAKEVQVIRIQDLLDQVSAGRAEIATLRSQLEEERAAKEAVERENEELQRRLKRGGIHV